MATRDHPNSDSLSPSERVISEVAGVTGTDPLELPPLYGTVDPDALDAILPNLESGWVEFRYAGRLVRVGHDGSVDVSNAPAVGSNRSEPTAGD